MEYRYMGQCGLRVSAIGFGTWELGGTQYGPIDEGEAVKAIYRALELGVTCIDTAPAYGHGHAEEVLGRALGPRRKEVVLVTKCGLDWKEDKRIYRDSSPARIIAGAEESLKRLQTDYVDLYLVHWPDPERPLDEAMKALQEVRRSGKARYVGVSNFHVHQMEVGLKFGALAANQVGYNLFDHRPEQEVIPFCRENGIGIMAYGPLAYGLLTGTFTPETKFAEWDWRSSGRAFGQALFTLENFPKNLAVVEMLKGVARAVGKTLPQLAVNWVLREPAVAVALTGARRPQEIEENVGAVGWKLSEGDLKRIEEAMQGAAGLLDKML